MRIRAGVPRLLLVLPLVTACTGGPSADAPEPAQGAAAEPALGPAPGWGAVFWRGGQAWKVGEGERLVGPRGVSASASGDRGECGGVLVQDAPKHAVLAVPSGAVPTAPQRPPVVAATIVEAAAWRLDETLPARDGFAPLDPDAAPPRQRGVVVGSVIKQRRSGGPPVYLAVGARDCTAAAVVLDHEARTVLDAVVVPEVCGPVRALPPAQLDGAPGLESAMFDDEAVVLVRLSLTPATASLEAQGLWRCPAEPAGGQP